MSAAPRLTRDLLAVHEGAAAGYASERERSEAGSEAGEIEPASRLAAHDPYARSAGTFRGALQGLGIDPTKPSPRSRLQLQTGGGGNASTAAASGARGASSSGGGGMGMSAWDRHKQLASDYARYYSSPAAAAAAAAAAAPQKTDADVLRENHLFVRTPADDAAALRDQDKRMAKSYYDKLFKEYALGDLTRYKTGEVGLRWRTEAEVLSGKGHFTCGSKHCQSTEGLTSFEVNFGYEEQGVHKQALVKLRLCVDCGLKLHYKKLREMEGVQREAKREHAKKEEEQAAERKARKKERKREKKKSAHNSSSKKHSKRSGDKRRRSHSASDSSDSSADAEVTVLPSFSSHTKAAKTDSASSATSVRAHAIGASEPAFAVPAPQMSVHDPRYVAPTAATGRIGVSPPVVPPSAASGPSTGVDV